MRIFPSLLEEKFVWDVVKHLDEKAKPEKLSQTKLIERLVEKTNGFGKNAEDKIEIIGAEGLVEKIVLLYRNFVAGQISIRLRSGSEAERWRKAKVLAGKDIQKKGDGEDKRWVKYNTNLDLTEKVYSFYEEITGVDLKPSRVMHWSFADITTQSILKSILYLHDSDKPFLKFDAAQIEELKESGLVITPNGKGLWDILREAYGENKVVILPSEHAIEFASPEYRRMEKKNLQSANLGTLKKVTEEKLPGIIKEFWEKYDSGLFNNRAELDRFLAQYDLQGVLFREATVPPEVILGHILNSHPTQTLSGAFWYGKHQCRRYLFVDAIEGAELFGYLRLLKAEREKKGIRNEKFLIGLGVDNLDRQNEIDKLNKRKGVDKTQGRKAYANCIDMFIPSRTEDKRYEVTVQDLPLQDRSEEPNFHKAMMLYPQRACNCQAAKFRGSFHRPPETGYMTYFDPHLTAAYLELAWRSHEETTFREKYLEGKRILASPVIVPSRKIMELSDTLRHQTLIAKPDTNGTRISDYRPLNDIERERIILEYMQKHLLEDPQVIGTSDLRKMELRFVRVL